MELGITHDLRIGVSPGNLSIVVPTLFLQIKNATKAYLLEREKQRIQWEFKNGSLYTMTNPHVFVTIIPGTPGLLGLAYAPSRPVLFHESNLTTVTAGLCIGFLPCGGGISKCTWDTQPILTGFRHGYNMRLVHCDRAPRVTILGLPSLSPSSGPSQGSPSGAPSSGPSQGSPSRSPSLGPSGSPSLSPSGSPSSSPTWSPTQDEYGSYAPSTSPTVDDYVEPTPEPSRVPVYLAPSPIATLGYRTVGPTTPAPDPNLWLISLIFVGLALIVLLRYLCGKH